MKILYVTGLTVLILFSLPLMLCIGIILLIVDGTPVFFVQKRIGKDGKSFFMYKFRTMIRNAEKQKIRYIKLNEASGPAFKIRLDPRFTKIGRFLSHTGLDELPQLFNVLKGDMALLGPRPLPVDEASKLTAWQKKRHIIKPGIISPWILEGYHAKTFDEWMKSDCEYVATKSLLTDVKLFFRATGFMVTLFYRTLFS